MNTIKTQLIDKITANGGYRRNHYGGNYPIAFKVKIYSDLMPQLLGEALKEYADDAPEWSYATGFELANNCPEFSPLDLFEALRPGYKLELATRTRAANTFAGDIVGIF